MTEATIKNALNNGLRHHQAGQLPEAENLYRQVLANEPYHAEALHLLGVIAYQNCQAAVAVDLIQRAIVQKPQVSDFHSNLGLVFSSLGKVDNAIAAYRRALALKPESVEVLNNLGGALKEKGQFDESLAVLKKALALRSDSAVTLNNIGGTLRAMGNIAGSIESYRKALQLVPDYPDAHNNLGAALAADGHIEAAIEEFKKAVAIRPDFADAHYNMGNVYRQHKRPVEAEQAYRRALAVRPDYPEALNNLGNLVHAHDENALHEAIALFQKAIALKPGFAEAHRNLGLALVDEGKFDEAAESFEKSLALVPDNARAWNDLGTALLGSGRESRAVQAFQKAADLEPSAGLVYNNMANVLKDMGQLDEALKAFERGIEADPGNIDIATNRLYLLNVLPSFDRAAIFAEQRKFNEKFCAPLKKCIRPHDNDRNPDRKLRIGYVSADFRDHVAGFNLLPLIVGRDRNLFDAICYSNTLRSDAVSHRFQEAADGFHVIRGMDDESVEELIRRERIDILMDLSLHSGGTRMLVMARKPAPVQATFIGYPGSTGLDTVDYRFTDPYLEPPGEFDKYYSEKSLRLPDSFWCYDSKSMQAPISPINPLPALSAGHVTFGCLCNFCKVNDGVLELWSKVLKEVADSRMVILVPPGPARQRVIIKFEEMGIDPVRLEFFNRQSRPEYMKTYQHIDIGLDTLPYNGHTTSLDSCWMGVPVVTLIGQTVVGRAGFSQLSNLKLTDLAASTPEEFVRIAADIAGDLPRLGDLRRGLRHRMLQSPLCNAAMFTKKVESAYRHIWRTWCETA